MEPENEPRPCHHQLAVYTYKGTSEVWLRSETQPRDSLLGSQGVVLHTGYVQHGSGRHRLAINILWLYVLQGLNYITPLAVLPYLVRVLGMEMYGQVAFAQSFAQYFTLLTDYGFNLSATRAIAQQRDDHKRVCLIFSSVLLLKLALMFLGGLVLCILVAEVPQFHQNSAFFDVAYLTVIGNVLFPIWCFQGMERMRYISAIIGTARLGGAVALFAFVHRPEDALLSLAIQSIAFLIGGVAGLCIAFWKFDLYFVCPGIADFRLVIVEGWHLFVSTAAISLYTNTNVFLVGFLAGNLQAGYFSVAEKLIRAMQGLLGPVTQAIFPYMSSLAAQSRAAALQFARQTLSWVGTISFVSSLVIFALAGPIALLCFGPKAIDSVPIIRWIALLPFLTAISNILGIQTMVPFGLDKQFSRILILAGLFNLAVAIPLIKIFAARGAGASILLTECLVTVGMVIVLDRNNIKLCVLKGFSA